MSVIRDSNEVQLLIGTCRLAPEERSPRLSIFCWRSVLDTTKDDLRVVDLVDVVQSIVKR